MSGRQAPGLASPRPAAIVPFPAAKAGCCPDGPAAGTPSANGLKLVAAYARVSSDKQEKEQTIDSQIEALRRVAEERGWQLGHRPFRFGPRSPASPPGRRCQCAAFFAGHRDLALTS